MPVIIPVDLPATETLKQEFIPVMHESAPAPRTFVRCILGC